MSLMGRPPLLGRHPRRAVMLRIAVAHRRTRCHSVRSPASGTHVGHFRPFATGRFGVAQNVLLLPRKVFMRVHLAACLIIVLCASDSRAQSTEPTGQNCRLAVPPSDAGESPDHGVVLRVYPRARDISSRYSGCQTMWAPQAERWLKISVAEIVNGDPVRLWTSDDVGGAISSCRYEKGKIVSGEAGACPAPAFLIQQSFPAGCASKLFAAKGGPVAGCEIN